MANISRRRKRRQVSGTPAAPESRTENADRNNGNSFGKLFFKTRRSWLIIAITAVVALGALGAGLKYLEEEADRQMTNGQLKDGNFREKSFLNTINPFLADPPPTPTPQLSKEYIYAGGKMLAVEDANANAAPPADLAVWRPSNGAWYVMGQSGSQQTSIPWGQSGDKTVPGDYDGDGKTDFSVFRPSDGNWYVQRSSDGGMNAYTFGLASDQVAAADYDGDGRTDVAVYRPSNGYWYILQSSDGVFMQQQWGVGAGVYTITPADFDGDGKADFAVWYDDPDDPNHTRQFVIKRSSDGQTQSIVFGQMGDLPVPGDYDGDGKADAAVWRSGVNQWHILKSSNQTTQVYTFGVPESDVAVQNDYDGDGRVDPAVWRPLTGVWYILQSSKEGDPDHLRQTQWGQNGDIPVPAFYRR